MKHTLNLFLTFAFVALSAFSQVTPQQAFDNAFWASQPPAVQALKGNHNFDLAASLAAQGYIIDNAIMVWGYDPYITMQARVAEGLTWITVGYENPVGCVGLPGVCYALPGLAPLPGQVKYPTTAPAGLVTEKVSTNPADFPAYKN